ncbi:MAG: glycosyl hydrolase 2 galactose-binding domain-containing protein [Solirubrobacteraceae bacterium]
MRPRQPITCKAVAALLATGAIAVLAAPAASADVTTAGLGGWQVQSTAQATQAPAAISTPGFATASWLHVRPDDAGAPGTEVGALVQTGHCPNVFFSTNMKDCFGYLSEIDDPVPQFAVPWWFRTDFTAHPGHGDNTDLIVNGVVGEADVWVNGHEVATRDTVQGAFTRYTFDVTGLLRHGVNTLALEVYPNNPNTMFTLDNVDWTQIPPDNNTGFQFPIQLHTSGPLALSNAHVVQDDAQDVSTAALTLKGDVTNHADAPETGDLSAVVTSPTGRAIRLSRRVTVAPGQTQTVSFDQGDDPRLLIEHPSVWWPHGMGAQPLYGLRMSLDEHGSAPDTESETFGIRKVTTKLIGPSPAAPQGSRQFAINGVPFVFRGGGWSEDLFLRYSSADTANQIAEIENLGLNGIRTEGKQMPDDFYEQMDRAGILIDGGFQCCDRWQLPRSERGVTAHDFAVLQLSALTIGQNLRNHPSVLNFSWSDNAPTQHQEAVSLEGFQQADSQEPLIASAEYKKGTQLETSGEKEGPYDWVPPSYWYDTSHYDPGDSSRTNVGGAWAFDSEASAGHTVPTLDSIQRFLSPFEQDQLWQNPDYNQYHANYEPDLPGPDNGGYSFGTLHDLDAAISNRYGTWSSLSQYVQEAQVQNYETQRAEFEAYIDHSTNNDAPSTGIVYWQLNKGWPTLLWDLYNNDFDQAGSYFGAKKANERLHVLYTYDDGTVSVDNLSNRDRHGLSVVSNVYGVDGQLLDHQTASHVSVGGQGVARNVLHPAVPAATTPPAPAKTYFVELLLERHGKVVDRNVYWLSTQQDVVDWSKTIGNPQATMTQFANLGELQSLPAAAVRVRAHTVSARGGLETTVVRITNTSKQPTVAFFLRADVRRATRSGTPAAGDNEVLPIFWSDNDVTLWPGESRTLRTTYRRADLHGASPLVSVSAWNSPLQEVPAS